MYRLNPVPPAFAKKQEMKQNKKGHSGPKNYFGGCGKSADDKPYKVSIKQNKNCAPPKTAVAPMSYVELLKLAEKLQFEPVLKTAEKRLRTAQEYKVSENKARNGKRGLQELPHLKRTTSNSPPFSALNASRLSSPLQCSAKSAKKGPSQRSLLREPPKLGQREAGTEWNLPSRAGTNGFIQSAPSGFSKKARTQKPRPGGNSQCRPASTGANASVSRLSKSVSHTLKRKYDDEEENDSEMDDFIVDDDIDQEKISKHIREIFGYDRRKYNDESDDDLRSMESSWSEQQKEEAKSLKLAMLEEKEEEQRELEEMKLKKAKKRKLA